MAEETKYIVKTCKEFNEKYKDYLAADHYGLDMSNPDIIKFLDDIFVDFIKIPGFQYFQIKWKFSTCRFYSSLGLGLSSLIERQINLLNAKS